MRHWDRKLAAALGAVAALIAAGGIAAFAMGGGAQPATGPGPTATTTPAAGAAPVAPQSGPDCGGATACATAAPSQPGIACPPGPPPEPCYPDARPAGPYVCVRTPAPGGAICRPPWCATPQEPAMRTPESGPQTLPACLPCVRTMMHPAPPCPTPVPCFLDRPQQDPPSGPAPKVAPACPMPCVLPAPGAPTGIEPQIMPFCPPPCARAASPQDQRACPIPPPCVLPTPGASSGVGPQLAPACPVPPPCPAPTPGTPSGVEPQVAPACPVPPPCIVPAPGAPSGIGPQVAPLCPAPMPPSCAVSSAGALLCPTPGASASGSGWASAGTAVAEPAGPPVQMTPTLSEHPGPR